MIYKKFKDLEISALGMGGMRFPVSGSYREVDRVAVREMVAFAIEKGVNYFDTAWGYHGGESETVLGEVLEEFPRERFFLATKFPGYDLKNMDKVEEIFEEQLKKCRVDYFDFYLFHNVCERNIDAYLDSKFGIFDYLVEQKRKGRIRHLGFSTHGTTETMTRFLEAYGHEMEFCQIQLNWLDWKMQKAKEKMALLKDYHLPVWVMEPLRGGMLTSIGEEHCARLKELRPEVGEVEWSFRFLQSFPEVVVTLSGMSDLKQLKENVAIYEQQKPLSKAETERLFEVARAMTAKDTLPCTECGYCISHCPLELPIPKLIGYYNEHAFSGGGFLAPMAVGALPEEKRPSACVGCRSCEAVCPQTIEISQMMQNFTKMLKKE